MPASVDMDVLDKMSSPGVFAVYVEHKTDVTEVV